MSKIEEVERIITSEVEESDKTTRIIKVLLVGNGLLLFTKTGLVQGIVGGVRATVTASKMFTATLTGTTIPLWVITLFLMMIPSVEIYSILKKGKKGSDKKWL